MLKKYIVLLILIFIGISYCDGNKAPDFKIKKFQISLKNDSYQIKGELKFNDVINLNTITWFNENLLLFYKKNKSVYYLKPKEIMGKNTCEVLKQFTHKDKFDNIENIAYDFHDCFYAENILWKENKDDSSSKKLSKKEKKEHFIYKFSLKDEFHYKLGKGGRSTGKFDDNIVIQKMICDIKGNLYLIIRHLNESKNNSISNINDFEIIRFNRQGKYDFNWLPSFTQIFKHNPNYIPYIEDIVIAPRTQNYVIFVTYYTKSKKKNKPKFKIAKRRIYIFELTSEEPKLQFDVENLSASIWGITINDEIYLRYPNDRGEFSCLIYDMNGNIIKEIKIPLTEINQYRQNFIFNSDGSILGFNEEDGFIYTRLYYLQK